MNKRFHRVVFSVARGLRMAVQETARSASKAGCGSTSARSAVAHVLALAISLTAAAAAAQIAADPNAPGRQRPTVLVAPNGVPLINIQTPSAAGVSRNTYRQFDVGAQGVVLNNSRTNVQSRLGGLVTGNPWLATGPARVILNEVDSSNPSYLNGPVEIAGQRAEFVLANPSGISVNGSTFINASAVTLTTGTPQFGTSGSLDSYAVRGGTVSIDGAGMDARTADYAAILARATQINAGVWARDLKVATGANDVSADASQVTPVTVAGAGADGAAAPRFALDVAAVGGMYANHIFLIGTEAGLGMRNAGVIQTSSGPALITGEAGRLTLSVDGLLENSGLIQLASDGSIKAAELINSGTVRSAGSLQIATQGDLANHLASTGGTLEGQRVELASAAGDLDNRGGTIRQTSAAGLAMAAPRLSNTSGGVIGAEPVRASVSPGASGTASSGSGAASGTDGAGGATNTTTNPPADTTGGTGTGSATGTSPSAPTSIVVSPGSLTAAGGILNDGGKVYTGGPITLQTPAVNNSGGSLSVASLAVTGATFSNAGGTLNVANTFSANVGTLDNTGGSLHANRIDIKTTGDLNNRGGALASVGTADLSVGGAVDNSRGTLAANRDMAIAAASLDNDRGLVQSGGAMAIDTHGRALTNTNSAGYANGQGGIASNGTLSLNAGAVDNTAGFIGAAGTLTARTGAFTNAAGGVLLGQSDVAITTNGATYDNRGGQTLAVGDLTVDTGTATVQNDGALIRSGGTTTVRAGGVVNTSTLGIDQGIEGLNVVIAAANVDNGGGAIRADANATITSAGAVNNVGGLMSARDTLAILDPNRASPGSKSLCVANTGGTLTADRRLQLDAAAFSGDGTLTSGQDLWLSLTQNLVNDAVVSADGDLSYITTGTLTNNGKLLAGNVLTLSGSDVENAAGGEMRGDTTIVGASGTLTNRGLIDGRDTRIDARALVNAPTGRIYGDHLSIAAGSILNDGDGTSAGTIAARDRLDIGADTITNREHALIFSAGDMHIGGALDANRRATGQATAIDNSSASIESLGNMHLAARTIGNTDAHLSVTREPVSSVQVVVRIAALVAVHVPVAGELRHLFADEPLLVEPIAQALGDGGRVIPQRIEQVVAGEPLAVMREGWIGFDKVMARRAGHGLEETRLGNGGVRRGGANDALASRPCRARCATHSRRHFQDHARTAVAGHIARRPGVARDAHSCRRARWAARGGLGALLVAQGRQRVGGHQVGGRVRRLVGEPFGSAVEAAVVRPVSVDRRAASALDLGTLRLDVLRRLVGGDGSACDDLAVAVHQQAVDVDVAARDDPARIAACGHVACGGQRVVVVGPRAGDLLQPVVFVHAVVVGGDGGVERGQCGGVAVLVGGDRGGVGLLLGDGADAHRAARRRIRLDRWHDAELREAGGVAWLPCRDGCAAHGLACAIADGCLDNGLRHCRALPVQLGMGLEVDPLAVRRDEVGRGLRCRPALGQEFGEAQYVALMNAGATFAQQYQLTPGIALSAAQMAQLTSDIVWLVEQTVTLADGSTQKVLVPQLYVRVKPGDIDGSGALLSADALVIQNAAGEGDMVSSGTIAGRTMVSITADNIRNLGGRITGGSVGLAARQDLNDIGGMIEAQNSAMLTAGHDIDIASTTRTQVGAQGSRTNLDRIAGVYVTNPGGSLVVSAGNDVNVIGAVLANTGAGGVTLVKAGNDINLGTVETASSQDTTWDAGNYVRASESHDIGAVIAAEGSVRLVAGNGIAIKAGAVSSGEALTATAGNDIRVTSGEAVSTFSGASFHESHGLLSSSSSTRRDNLETTQVLSSQLGGNSVLLVAGNDIALEAAQLHADGAISLSAGRDITLGATNRSATESHFKQDTHSASGIGKAIGIALGADTVACASRRSAMA